MTKPIDCFVFAYGSLINPSSAARNLPHLDDRWCLPAHCVGMRRTFGVAFPNDGSQIDKWYADDRGHRPPRILFANLEPFRSVTANGVLIPVTRSDLQGLLIRELRYELVDVTSRVRLWDWAPPAHPVTTFLGRAQFTHPQDVAAGVIPAAYLQSIQAGTRFWERRARGFDAAFAASTLHPPPDRVRSLTRFDTALQ